MQIIVSLPNRNSFAEEICVVTHRLRNACETINVIQDKSMNKVTDCSFHNRLLIPASCEGSPL